MGDEKKEWMQEADEALRKTGDSLSAAWEATRETRMSALQAAKEALGQLGDAIDKGVLAAKQNWASESPGASEEE